MKFPRTLVSVWRECTHTHILSGNVFDSHSFQYGVSGLQKCCVHRRLAGWPCETTFCKLSYWQTGVLSHGCTFPCVVHSTSHVGLKSACPLALQFLTTISYIYWYLNWSKGSLPKLMESASRNTFLMLLRLVHRISISDKPCGGRPGDKAQYY